MKWKCGEIQAEEINIMATATASGPHIIYLVQMFVVGSSVRNQYNIFI
jgi:hypothetical protein